MASYRSYKRLNGDQVLDKSIDTAHLASGVRSTYTVKWFYGTPDRCSPGCCCLWTVPNSVCQLNWELWGAGGNGNGACSCNRCHHTKPAGGGAHTSKSIRTAPGCQYTVCAAGVYRCLSRECWACNGCTSYVNGYNLSNLCACGGGYGEANTAWTDGCFSYGFYCVRPGCVGTAADGDWASYNHTGNYQGQAAYQYPGGTCHCWKHIGHSTGAAGLSDGYFEQNSNYCWIRCGCWIVPYGAGGQSATTNYCGRCCGQGGTGGGGIVKVTYF